MNRQRLRKTNTTRNRGGMQRGSSLTSHPDSIKPQVQDIYSNARFCDTFGKLKGCHVEIKVNSGRLYEGILHTISSKGEIVLQCANLKEKNHLKSETLTFKSSNIVHISAKDVDMEYSIKKSESLQTDAEISQRINGQPQQPRKLEEWNNEDDDEGQERLLNTDLNNPAYAKDNGWSAEDMFHTNKQHFGYSTTFDVKLGEYTTPLAEEDTKEFRDRKARAEKLAMEIEKSPDHSLRSQIENNDEMTEEERFSSVTRIVTNPRPAAPITSNNQNKYVPPNKRLGNNGNGSYRGAQARKQSPLGPPSSGPGRPPMQPGGRRSPLTQSTQIYQRDGPPNPVQIQKQPTASSNPGHIGAMSNDYSRLQHTSQPPKHHPHPSVSPQQQQQQSYQQRSQAGIGGPASTLGPRAHTPVEQEQPRVPTISSSMPLGTNTEGVIPKPEAVPSSDARVSVGNQSSPAAVEQKSSEISPTRIKEVNDLKKFAKNFVINETSDSTPATENKVPAPSSNPPSKVEVEDSTLPPSVGTTLPTESPGSTQPEAKAASTSPMPNAGIPGGDANTLEMSSDERDRQDSSKLQSTVKDPEHQLNPNAKPFIPRIPSQKTPTPPPSRSPQMTPAQMMPPPQYMPVLPYATNGAYVVTSNAPGMQQFQQMAKQVHPSRGERLSESLYANVARIDYNQPYQHSVAGQPLVSPMTHPIIVTAGQGGVQPGQQIKMVPPMINPIFQKPQQMTYRTISANPAAVSAMHQQVPQMVPGTEGGGMMHQVMALHPQQAPQPQHHQPPQGHVQSGQYVHNAQSHVNAANQMQQQQQPQHTTPPLQQSQQQGQNHPVMAQQGQFQQHGGRPSPGPMQQMAQAQGPVIHGVIPQLVSVYAPMQPGQPGQGMPAQHAGQQYGNISQHHIGQQGVQVQTPAHVSSNMTNITNVTRVHADPHPHSIPSAVYMTANPGISHQQSGLVPNPQLPGSYMSQHGSAYQTGN